VIAQRKIDERHAHVGEEIGATLALERAGGDRPVCVAEFLIRLQV
jgi:hypothetical protein